MACLLDCGDINLQSFRTSQIIEQQLFADKDFPALAFTGTDATNTPLRDQFADCMLGDAPDRFGTFLDRENFHGHAFCLLFGRLVINELGQQIENSIYVKTISSCFLSDNLL